MNVGRTLRFLCDKYAKTMTPEVRYPGLLQTDATKTSPRSQCYGRRNTNTVYDVGRKLFCMPSSNPGSRRSKTLNGTSRTMSYAMVLALLTSRRSLSTLIVKQHPSTFWTTTHSSVRAQMRRNRRHHSQWAWEDSPRRSMRISSDSGSWASQQNLVSRT